MKIIIVGLSSRGISLADCLAQEGHDVVVIDSKKEKVDEVTDKYSVSGVVGSGVSREVLMKAGADTADVIIALSDIDEVNLMTCMIAKKAGTRYAAARIYQPDISGNKETLAEDFLVDYLINPKMETADRIVKQIGLPGSIKAEAFFDNQASLIRVTVEKGIFPKDHMPMHELKRFFDTEMLVTSVVRDGKFYIPKGDFEIESGDILGILAGNSQIYQLVSKLGLVKKPAKKVFLIGGGDIAYFLAKKLEEQKLQVTILEYDKKRCLELSEMLPNTKICYADGLKADIMLEEGLQDADVSISLTGSDEHNLVVSLFAWSIGIPSIITKVNSEDYEKLLKRVNIDITISPSVLTVDAMLSFVRDVTVYNASGHDVTAVYRIADGMAEAIEVCAYEGSKKLGVPLKTPGFGLKKNLLIAMIVRENQCIIPNGNDVILAGDKVIVITARKQKIAINTFQDIFDK